MIPPIRTYRYPTVSYPDGKLLGYSVGFYTSKLGKEYGIDISWDKGIEIRIRLSRADRYFGAE